jgi:hypothetical protein
MESSLLRYIAVAPDRDARILEEVTIFEFSGLHGRHKPKYELEAETP